MGKLIPLVFLLVGRGAGIGAAMFLGPSGTDEAHTAPVEEPEEPESDSEYTRIPNQFVVPLIKDDRVAAMVVISLSIESDPDQGSAIYAREPKLRDLFLRVFFDHANMGGFRGSFTKYENMELLRNALREVAQKEMGSVIRDVLITEIARQEM